MISVVIVGQYEDSGYYWINLVIAILIITAGITHLMYLFNYYLFQQVLSERREIRKYKNATTTSTNNNSLQTVNEKSEQEHGHEHEHEHEQAFSIELHHLQLELLATIRKHTILSFVMIGVFLIATLTPQLELLCGNDETCTAVFWCIWWP